MQERAEEGMQGVLGKSLEARIRYEVKEAKKVSGK